MKFAAIDRVVAQMEPFIKVIQMKAKFVKNSPASVRARLLVHARQHGDDYQRVLARYAIERLLFRISQTEAANDDLLKGAMLLVTWPERVFRPTGDLDLLGQGDPDPASITELFTSICQMEVADDGITFDPATLNVEAVREADKYQGVQLTLKAELAKAVIHVRVDIGFGDLVYPPPKRGNFPSLLPGLSRTAASGAASYAETRRRSHRRRSLNCRKTYGAFSVPSSRASERRKVPGVVGTRAEGPGAKDESRQAQVKPEAPCY